LVAEAPGSQIQQIAPILSAAVQLQNNGNEQMVTEMADVTETMRGTQDTRQAIVKAAQQMMKGADTAAFLTNAGKMAFPKQQAQLSPGEVEPAPVNIDTIGGVSGLMGVSSFAPATLNEISPPLIEHGHENLLSVLTEKKVIPDPLDPEAPDVVVEAIDELDGSKLVDLMSTLARDQEWDQYLLGHVRDFLNELKFDEASELSNRIQNPVVRVAAFSDMMVARSLNEQPHEIKLLMARVRLDVDRIGDTDTKAMVMLNLGRQLGNAGITGQPEESIERVVGMAGDAEDNLAKSGLHSRLAVGFYQNENTAKTKQHFKAALNAAGQLEELAQRIDAFTKIAQRYYDVRNTTLANEILAEASVLAASELEPESRATAFGKIAMAQGYLGDFVGAKMSIDNGGREHGKQQLIAKLAESLIGLGRYYEALALMESMEDELEYNRLELRLSSKLIHEDRIREARNRLDQGSPRVTRIYDFSERRLITSQYARLYMRIGDEAAGERLFKEALDMSEQLRGRKAQVNRGIVALDWARSLMVPMAKTVLEDVTDYVVKDPIESEVEVTDRIIRTLLPKSLLAEIEAKQTQK